MADKKISDLSAVSQAYFIETETAGGASGKLTAGFPIPFISGKWWLPLPNTMSNGSAMSANTIVLIPFFVPRPLTVQAFGARVSTLHAANNVQFAIYATDLATGRPTGNALASTSNMSVAATGTVTAAPAGGNFTLAPGVYWMAVNSSGSTAVLVTYATTGPVLQCLIGGDTIGHAINAAPLVLAVLTVAQAFGTWPDLTSGSFTAANSASHAFPALQVA